MGGNWRLALAGAGLAACNALAPTASGQADQADQTNLPDTINEIAQVADEASFDSTSNFDTVGEAALADSEPADTAEVQSDVADAVQSDQTPQPSDVGEIAVPSPLTATGKFVEVSNVFGTPLLTNGGEAKKKLPRQNAGLWFDLDGDGILDLVLSDGIDEIRFGKGKGPWQWQWQTSAKVAYGGVNSIAAIDDDGDGKCDVVVSAAGLRYYKQKPDGSWPEEGAQRGLSTDKNTQFQALMPADVDGDGLLDLLSTAFDCSEKSRLVAYINQGNGQFVERGIEMGLDHKSTLWNAFVTDVDGDRRSDVLTLSEGCEPVGGNAYLHNAGFQLDKPYETIGLGPAFFGKALANGSPMGGGVADFNNDGALDIVISGIGFRYVGNNPTLFEQMNHASEATQLLLNDGKGKFTSAGVQAGIVMPLSSTGAQMVAWSIQPVDFDFDGNMDMLAMHAYDFGAFLLADEGGMHPVLFRNIGIGVYAEVSNLFGLPDPFIGRALTVADADGDGDLDLLMGGQGAQPRMYRNDIKHNGQWLQVRLKGSVSNIWGLGARLKLITNKHSYINEMTLHDPSHSVDAPVAQFAVRQGEIPVELRVSWPSGWDQKIAIGQLNQAITVTEAPLVQLGARYVQSVANAGVVVKAAGFDESGVANGGSVVIELNKSAQGQWAGPQTCDATGLCSRTWQPSPGKSGEAVLDFQIGGKALLLKPRIRFGK